MTGPDLPLRFPRAGAREKSCRRHRHLAATDAEMTHLSVTAGGAHHLDPQASPDRRL